MLNRDMALSSQLIENFQTELLGIRACSVADLPDLSGHINHFGQLTQPPVDLSPGLFLDGRVAGVYDSITTAPPDSVGFMVRPGDRLGREDSHNNLFVGKLIMEQFGKDALPVESHVAVKPLPKSAPILGELAMFQYLQQLGIPTFQPSGLLIAKDTSHNHLLTKFNSRVETLDTVDWAELDEDERWGQLGAAVETAALVNSEVLFHGDLEIRNVAADEARETFIVDPEFMVSGRELAEIAMNSSDEVAASWTLLRLKELMNNELKNICKSIDELIFRFMPEERKPQTDAAKQKRYDRRLYKPYREALKFRNSPYLPVLMQTLDLVVHEETLRAHGINPAT